MKRNSRKIKKGIVIGVSGEKTIKIVVERLGRHPVYEKIMKRSKNYLVHCEDSDVKNGDVVEIAECRPISKNKNWRLHKVIKAVNS